MKDAYLGDDGSKIFKWDKVTNHVNGEKIIQCLIRELNVNEK
jgi:hypothetical protein